MTVQYEYKILSSERTFYPDTQNVRDRGLIPGWTDWSDYENFHGYNRPSNQPYRTIAGVKSVITRYTRFEYGSGAIVERKFRVQRRPVVEGWEDFDL